MDRRSLHSGGVASTALAAVAIILAIAWLILDEPPLYRMTAEQVDRLRMAAQAGQDKLALDKLRRAARQDNTEAMLAAGSVLLRQTAPAAIEEGMQFAQAAAKRGDPGAQYLVGKAYFDGVSSPKKIPDLPKAKAWFEMAAERNHAPAIYQLGIMYKGGYGIARDSAIAAQWFEKAAELGNADAMFMLGNLYLNGEGVPLSPREALRMYMKAAALDHPLAAQSIAYAFKDGGLGLPRSERQSEQMMLGVAHMLRHAKAMP